MEFSTKKSVWIPIILLFIILSLLVALLFYFSDIFIVLIVGGVIILITERSHKRFRKIILGMKLHENKILKTTFTTITILFWLILLYLLISFTVKDINSTVGFMQENNVSVEQIYVEKGEAILGEDMVNLIQTENILNSIQSFITKILLNLVSGIAIFIAEAIIIIPLMFVFYFKNKNKLKEKISKLIPTKFREGFINIISNSSKKLKDYTYTKLVESFIIAIISAIGFYIAGLKGWLLFALLCGVLNIIPYIGPWMGAVGPILVSLLSPTTSTFLITGITLIFAQLVDNFYIIPFLIPKQLSVHPLISIIIILIGAKLFGPLGMLMALPIYSVYVVVLSGSYKELARIYNPRSIGRLKTKKK